MQIYLQILSVEPIRDFQNCIFDKNVIFDIQTSESEKSQFEVSLKLFCCGKTVTINEAKMVLMI